MPRSYRTARANAIKIDERAFSVDETGDNGDTLFAPIAKEGVASYGFGGGRSVPLGRYSSRIVSPQRRLRSASKQMRWLSIESSIVPEERVAGAGQRVDEIFDQPQVGARMEGVPRQLLEIVDAVVAAAEAMHVELAFVAEDLAVRHLDVGAPGSRPA